MSHLNGTAIDQLHPAHAVIDGATYLASTVAGHAPNNALIRAPIANSAIDAPITPWEAALQQITEHEARLERHRYPLRQTRFDRDALVVGERTLLLDNDGFLRLFRQLRAPVDYLMRLSPELRTRLVEHHLRETNLGGRFVDHNTVLLSRDGYFRGIDRDDLCRLTGTDVLHAVRDGVGGDHVDLAVQHLRLQHEALQIDVVSPSLVDEVRVGDLLRYGLRVRHSLVGDHATTIESFAFRLICSNGLVRRQCLGRKGTARSRPRTRRLTGNRGNASQQQRDQIRRLATEAWQHLRGMSQEIRDLQHHRFDMPSLQRFLRQARMHSARLARQMETAWAAEGAEPSAFGFLNALTRVATHETDLSDQQRRRLELLAGVFAGQQVHLCPQCFSLVAD